MGQKGATMELKTLANVLNALHDPVLAVGTDQKILIANRKAEALFEPNLAGRHILSLIRQPQVLVAIQDVLAGQSEASAKFTARRSVDETFQVLVAHLTENDGRRQGAVVSFRDVTPIERAEQIRSEFVANVSHELRSPLTALSGFIETLMGPAANDDAARRQFLTIMQTEANRMRRLTDDLLSLSRVEANERVRPTVSVDLADIAKRVIAALAPLAATRSAEIDLTVSASSTTVPGDQDQLTQVLQNLVENALKYSGGGRVSLRITALERFVGIYGPVLRLDVSDSGPGIAAHHLPRLTERFYRVDSHRSRHMGGTGLGLAIVKHITNRHRGRLLIDSELGKGSVFSVVLPTT